MFHYTIYLVWFGALIQLLGSAAYIRDTLKGKTKPNRVTWFFWAVAPLVGSAAAISDGVGWAVLPVVMVGFVPLLILLASFANKQSYWQLGQYDYACGFFAALALVLWFITSDPKVAIIFSIAADALAGIPTLIKSWKNPETETSVEYAATIFAAVLGLLAVQWWRFSETAFPVYLIVLNGLVLLVIYRNKVISWLQPVAH